MHLPAAGTGTFPNGRVLAPHDSSPSMPSRLPVPTAKPTDTVPGFEGNLQA